MVEDHRRINEEILSPRVRVIDDKGEQLGVLILRDALNAARERELDLVEVAPNADPPVCRILDYGKYHYTQVKRMREARKAQKVTEIKEIRLRPKTDDYHTGFKVKRARDFLKQGMKVKVRVQFRGREITHPEIGLEHLREVAAELSDVAVVEQKPDMEGRTMLMVLAPTAAAIAAGIAEAAASAAKSGARPKSESAASGVDMDDPEDIDGDDVDDDDIDDDGDDDAAADGDELASEEAVAEDGAVREAVHEDGADPEDGEDGAGSDMQEQAAASPPVVEAAADENANESEG